jgi:hypothetical protein
VGNIPDKPASRSLKPWNVLIWRSISMIKLRFYFAISKIFRKNIPLYNDKINLKITV